MPSKLKIVLLSALIALIFAAVIAVQLQFLSMGRTGLITLALVLIVVAAWLRVELKSAVRRRAKERGVGN